MREIDDSAEATIDTDPPTLFNMITALERLPEWNDAIEKVIQRPQSLGPGSTWTVQMHPARFMSWKSVSTLEELDFDSRRFAYRTVNADGNPSYTMWLWEVTPKDAAARVSVRWDVYLETLDRRLLAGPIRRRQLRREVVDSLRTVASLLTQPA